MSLLNSILNIFLEKNLNSEENKTYTINNILDNYKNQIHSSIDSTINNININIDSKEEIFENNDNNDENREYKDFCTDIVTNYILDENELYNLLYIINTIYNNSISYYLQKKNLKDDDIIFLFKGGNIFKFIAHKFWTELPNKAMYKFIDIYKSYFKRSDLDFGIYVNPNLSTNIIDEITVISYKLQLIISDILLNNKNICFKWFKFNKNHQKEILKKLLVDLNNTSSLHESNSIYYNNKFTNIQFIDNTLNKTNYKYKNQSNYYFTFENDSYNTNFEFNNTIKKQKIITNNTTNNFMYNNINKALRIETTNNRILRFYLTRIKITFNLHLENKINNSNVVLIGGELIDVSIGRDEASEKFYKNKHLYVDSIKLIQNTGFYLNNITSFYINIYSFQYLYEDLKFILIDTLYLPWEDKKYKKRVYRLFYLTFIDLFKNTTNSTIKNKNISVVYQYYDILLQYIIKCKKEEKIEQKEIDKISRLLNKTKQDKILSYIECKKKTCLLSKLLKYIISIIEKILFPRNLINNKIHNNTFINNKINNKRILESNEFSKLIELLKYVKENLNSLKIVNEYILNYSKKNIEFNYKTIYSEQLI